MPASNSSFAKSESRKVADSILRQPCVFELSCYCSLHFDYIGYVSSNVAAKCCCKVHLSAMNDHLATLCKVSAYPVSHVNNLTM